MFGLCIAMAFTVSCASSVDKADDGSAAKNAIQQQIAKYAAALDAADIDLASQIWRTAADVSFIHPAGHARGWEEVKGIYQFFGSAFSERKLTVRDVAVHVNGDRVGRVLLALRRQTKQRWIRGSNRRQGNANL